MNGFLFEDFADLSQISAEKVYRHLQSPYLNKSKVVWDIKLVDNYLANRVVYPRIVPVDAFYWMLDLAILREALKEQGKNYLNPRSKKVFIPQRWLEGTTEMFSLVLAFVDAFNLQEVWSVISFGTRMESLGTIIKPVKVSPQGEMVLSLLGNLSQKYTIKAGSITQIPAPVSKVDVSLEIKGALLLGRTTLTLEVGGGVLGLMVDTRYG